MTQEEDTRLSSIPLSQWNNLQVKGKGKLNTGESVRFIAKVVEAYDDKFIVKICVIWMDGYGFILPYYTLASAKKLFTVHVWSETFLEIERYASEDNEEGFDIIRD